MSNLPVYSGDLDSPPPTTAEHPRSPSWREQPSAFAYVHSRWNSLRETSHSLSSVPCTASMHMFTASGGDAALPSLGHSNPRSNCRASVATLVFTGDPWEHVQNSPPLEDALSRISTRSGESGSLSLRGSLNLPATVSKAEADDPHCSADGLLSSRAEVVGYRELPTRKVEVTDLDLSHSLFLTMKQSHVENGSMLLPPSCVATESALCSDDSLRTWQHCSSWRISDGEQQLRRGAEVDLINEKTQLAGGKGRADESLGGDDTGGCCCCGCPSLFCFHLFGRRCGSELCCPHQEEQSSINGNTGTVLMLRPNSSADLSSGMRRLLPFQVFNNFSGDVSAASYIFCLLNYAAAISMIGTGCLHLMDTLNDRVSRVADGSVCDGVVLLEPITPDMVFTLVCFTINITAACIFAHRAVRYQHNGSLLCHLLAVLLVIGCFVNYLFGPHRGTVIRRISAWEIAALSGNVVLTATSCFLYAPVSKDFAWRLFMKGITLTSLIQQRRRWMHIQSCVQVDVLSAINTALVALYLVTSRLETWATVSLCALSVFMALHFTTMLKCQARWFLLLFIVLAAVSTGFNCYIAALGAGEYFVTNTMTHYDQGRCYRDMLQNCVWSTVTSLNSRNQAVSFLGSNVLSVMQRSNMSCVEDEPTPSGIVSNCCLDYGLCRLRDSVRFYASGAIMALVIITTTVRLLLVRLWIQTPVEQTSATGSVPITLVSSDIGGALAAGKQGTRGMRE